MTTTGVRLFTSAAPASAEAAAAAAAGVFSMVMRSASVLSAAEGAASVCISSERMPCNTRSRFAGCVEDGAGEVGVAAAATAAVAAAGVDAAVRCALAACAKCSSR